MSRKSMDLRFEFIAMLTMRARRFLKNTGRKLGNLGSMKLSMNKELNKKDCAVVETSAIALSVQCDGFCAMIGVTLCREGLESVEARLLVFKKNESMYEEDIKLLKHENYFVLRDLDLHELKREVRVIMDKCKTRLGYNAIPPPYTGNFMPPKPNLVYPSLDDFVEVNESVSKSIVEKPLPIRRRAHNAINLETVV
ncbi:hypothetical protein Tco_0827661 [Tanacetum coccineum]